MVQVSYLNYEAQSHIRRVGCRRGASCILQVMSVCCVMVGLLCPRRGVTDIEEMLMSDEMVIIVEMPPAGFKSKLGR